LADRHWDYNVESIEGKVLSDSLPSVGPGDDPGVQAVSPQVTLSHPPGGRLPLLSARLMLPSQLTSVTARKREKKLLSYALRDTVISLYVG